jgi:predicted negative regulator of RcsB-dependent stress response
VAELRSEEEQLEALKRWWNENGKTLLVAIVVTILGVVGWNYYQDQQRETAETASTYFQRLLGNAIVSPMDDSERAAIARDANMLKDQYSDGAYAQYAALMLAKLAVEDKDLEQAESELRWLLNNSPKSQLLELANIRLAQILWAQGRLPQALELVQDRDDAWQSRRLEVKGDILLAQGDSEGAREAYGRAQQVATDDSANTALLRLKLDNLAE